MSARNSEIWTDIQDVIGRALLWSVYIRRLFWTPGFNHFELILVCTFVYGNGLNLEVFLEWARLLNFGGDAAAYRHFETLFRLFGHRNYTLCAYNVCTGEYE
jgi:hypothetical protein